MAIPAISFFLFSALLYAAIPFVVLVSKTSTGNIVESLFLTTVGFSVLYCLGFLFDKARRAVLFDKELFFLSILNLAGFLGFVFAVSVSRGVSDPIYTLVIIESWPLIAALAYPIFKIRNVKMMSPSTLIVSCLALFGVWLIAFPQLQDSGDVDGGGAMSLIWPILGMISMVLGSLFKAKYVEIAKRRHSVDAVSSFFTMYAQNLPFALAYLAYVGLGDRVLSVEFFGITGASIALINAASAILFSYGTLKLRNTSDLFIWFFAPVFSVAFYCIYNGTLPNAYETAGISLIVGSNLLISLKSDERVGYRLGVLSMMVAGAICVFPSAAPMSEFYDALAVLAIFITITLAFMLERVAARAALEIDVFETAKSLIPLDDAGKDQIERIIAMQGQRSPIGLRRSYRKLVRLGASAEVLQLVRQGCSSRSRGLNLTNLFSVVATSVAILVLAAVARPIGWQHDFMVFLFTPSLVYALAYMIDLNNSRFLSYSEPRAGYIDFAPTQIRRRFGLRNQLWSMVLIIFLVANFLLGFLAKDDALQATQMPPECSVETCQPQTPEA